MFSLVLAVQRAPSPFGQGERPLLYDHKVLSFCGVLMWNESKPNRGRKTRGAMVRKLDAVAAANERIRYTSSVCGGSAASLVVAVLFDFLQKGTTSWFTWISVLGALALWYIGYMHLSWLKPEE